MNLRSPMGMIGAVVVAVVLAVAGVYFQLGAHNPSHPVSYKAIACWAAAVAALIAASFLRPRTS
jgi:hypothetical protein